MQLSKSDYITYLKHPAWLWLKKHDENVLPLPDENLKARFADGNTYEPYAEQLFPEGVRLGWDPKNKDSYEKLLTKTQAEMKKGTKTIFQGRFLSGNLTFICDIIDKTDDGSYVLYEVKATTEVNKKEHLPDLSFQQVVMERLGYRINKIYVVHLNNKYSRVGPIDINQLSRIEDVTDEVKALKPVTEEKIELALEIAESTTRPSLSPRLSGITKYRKEWMKIFRLLSPDIPEYSIYDLAGNNSSLVAELENKGILELSKIPEESNVSGTKAKAQIKVTKEDKLLVDKAQISTFLGGLEFPLYFLDYESFSKAIPPYDGTRPYQQVVFQYSVHTLESPEAELKHAMYLHLEDSNPLEPLTDSLMKVIGPKGSVIAWHKVFERDRNREMGAHSKQFFKFYQGLNDRLVDLKTPFHKDWYATKEFRGSASIKAVLPVVIPDLSYKDLQIQDGLTTGRIWAETVLDGKHDEQREKMFEEMRKYNTLDTLAMVEIYRKLASL
jgi:hypothetical protein